MHKRYSRILPFNLHKPVSYDYDERLPKPLAVMGWTNMYCKSVERGMLSSADKQTKELNEFKQLDGFILNRYTLNSVNGDFVLYSVMPESLKDEEKKNVVFSVHGGGFYYPLGKDAIINGSYIARQLNAIVFFPDYHVSSKCPFPGPLEDCMFAYRYLFDHKEELKIDVDSILIQGESAGACLAASLTMWIRDEKLTEPKGQILIVPVTDNDNEYPSNREYEYAVWPQNCNEHMWDVYLKDGINNKGMGKYAIPMKAEDLSNLPQAYIEVGGSDLLRDQGLAYANRLKEAGNPVKTKVISGGYHGYANDLNNEFVKQIVLNHCKEMRRMLSR